MILSTVAAPAEDSLLSAGRVDQSLPTPWRRRRRSGHRRVSSLGLIGLLLFAGGSAWAQQFRFNTVALSGQPAPGTPAGITFSTFGIYPTLNATGQTAFFAGVTGIGITVQNDNGLWTGAPGGVALLAREGNPAPNTPAGVNFAFLGDFLAHPPLNVAGQSAFSASVSGPGVTVDTDSGIWSGAPGSVAVLARAGDPAPGTAPGVNFLDFISRPAINAAGQSAFAASVTGAGVTPGTARGLWSGSLGSVALLARGGDPAPGAAAGVNYGLFFDHPTLNAAGQSAFSASVTGPGVTPANDRGIWSGAPGSVMLLVRGGDLAPGIGAGIIYESFSRPTLNAAGESAFSAAITGPGVTSDTDSGIWSGAPGSVALLARAGDPAPGTTAGVNYRDFAIPTLNAAGRSAFVAFVAGPGVTNANDSGLWLGKPGLLAKIFYESEAAPGAGVGAFFGGMSTTSEFALNQRGEVVFLNRMTGPGVTSANDDSLWFSDSVGNLSLIVRDGSPFEVAPGDTRILSAISFAGTTGNGSLGGSGGEDGFPSGLNDLGQVAFFAGFTDGSRGLFIATPAISIKIKTINKTGNTVTITLDSLTGYTFRLQRSLSLTPAAFINIGNPQAGSTGSVLTFTDSGATGNIAFYRVTAGP